MLLCSNEGRHNSSFILFNNCMIYVAAGLDKDAAKHGRGVKDSPTDE